MLGDRGIGERADHHGDEQNRFHAHRGSTAERSRKSTAARWWAPSAILLVVSIAGAAHALPPLQPLARSVGEGQGVYAVAGDGTVLVAQATNVAVHPASVSKVATTLALLERLGEDHRFETAVRASGAVRDGHLAGDLIVFGGGDPFLVDESACLLLARLYARGVRTVDGRLVVRGPLLFDWQPDPDGRRLQAVLDGTAGETAWNAVAGEQPARQSLRDAALVFRGGRVDSAPDEKVLVVLRSPRLLRVVKLLNGYSNNVFQYAVDAVGGAAAVQTIARAHVPAEMRDEIVIDNGAGAGLTNRLSPRAAVALLDALSALLGKSGHDLTAALPVSGVDTGTLEERFPERRALVVGKTGSFGSVGASSLVGVLRSRRYGMVRFAVLNRGVAVPEARRRQDVFVRALADAVEADPWPYERAAQPAFLEAEID